MASLFDDLDNPLAGLPTQDARQLLDWGEERARLMRDDPLNYGYPPHAGQIKVHEATTKEVLLIAANRWGKTVCGMREVFWRATGTHPYKKVRPHDVIWCGFVDYNFFNKTTKRVFDQWCPKEYLIKYHESEKWATFRRKDGGTCTVYFISYESGRETWQGGTVDFVWLDEEVPLDIYSEAAARLISTSGDMLLTQTPVSGLGWVYDAIYLPGLSGVRDTLIVQGALAEKDESKPYGVGKVLVPHLTYEQVLRFASVIRDPDQRDIRVFGEFKGRSGGVYKMFDPTVHVIPAFAIPGYFEKWGGVDPGYHGFAATLAAMDAAGRVYIAAEYFSQQESHQDRLTELWAIAQHVYQPDPDEWIPMYCDTANPQDILELNIWATKVGARLSFVSLQQGLKARMAGIQRVQEYLHPMPERATPSFVRRDRPTLGEPMLYFFDTMESQWSDEEESYQTSRLVWEMQRYLWAQKKRGGGHKEDDADENSAGGAHALATLRYLMMARMGAPEPPKEETRKGDAWVLDHMERLEAQIMASRRV